ncbi:hypothetical protein GCM10022382_10380 [Microbacterium invictum]
MQGSRALGGRDDEAVNAPVKAANLVEGLGDRLIAPRVHRHALRCMTRSGDDCGALLTKSAHYSASYEAVTPDDEDHTVVQSKVRGLTVTLGVSRA